jgi:hypothetical protein
VLCIQDMVSYSTVTISCLSHGRTQEVVQSLVMKVVASIVQLRYVNMY